MSKERVLVVDDEIELAEITRDYLQNEGFEVYLAYDGEKALISFEKYNPKLVILDIMLPKIDGMEVCRTIRAMSAIPIIMLSAKSSDIDKILSLGLGADDYMTKPFSPGELVARVKAQLRRYIHLSALIEKDNESVRFGSLVIDTKAYNTSIDGKNINLTAKEFELLNFMAHNPSQVFTREQLFNKIWGFDEYGDLNTVTVHIRKIREKIKKSDSSPVYIKTVWGVGYKFDGESDEK